MLNVKKFGATGDGATDDTGAIQDTVDAVPVDGGGVYLPPGTYKITAPVELRKGITVLGSNQAGTEILNDNDDDALVAYGDARNITIADMYIRDNLVTRTQGAAINFDIGGGYWNIQRVETHGHYNSIRVAGAMCCTMQDVVMAHSVSDGFYTEGTCNALSLKNVYANVAGGHGFNILNPVYSSLDTCACDLSVGDAYHFRASADNVAGPVILTLTSCGAEVTAGYSLYIQNGVHVILTGCYFANTSSDIIYLRGTINSSFTGVSAVATLPLYGLKAVASTLTACINIASFVSNISSVSDVDLAYTDYTP